MKTYTDDRGTYELLCNCTAGLDADGYDEVHYGGESVTTYAEHTGECPLCGDPPYYDPRKPIFRASDGSWLRIGDMVCVSNSSLFSAAAAPTTNREFRGVVDGVFVTRHLIAGGYATWRYAIPAKKKTVYVKKASEIVEWLEANGYTPALEGFFSANERPNFDYEMLRYCGKPKPDVFSWLPEWLEERED